MRRTAAHLGPDCVSLAGWIAAGALLVGLLTSLRIKPVQQEGASSGHRAREHRIQDGS